MLYNELLFKYQELETQHLIAKLDNQALKKLYDEALKREKESVEELKREKESVEEALKREKDTWENEKRMLYYIIKNFR